MSRTVTQHSLNVTPVLRDVMRYYICKCFDNGTVSHLNALVLASPYKPVTISVEFFIAHVWFQAGMRGQTVRKPIRDEGTDREETNQG